MILPNSTFKSLPIFDVNVVVVDEEEDDDDDDDDAGGLDGMMLLLYSGGNIIYLLQCCVSIVQYKSSPCLQCRLHSINANA